MDGPDHHEGVGGSLRRRHGGGRRGRGDGAARTQAELDEARRRCAAIVDTVQEVDRVLVTGHESMGYFADHYGFTLIGAVIPSLTSQAEASAGALAEASRSNRPGCR
ncbi:MAG: zinc ABC transporter substrate-binding protein [Acidimicrobiales bacterium]